MAEFAVGAWIVTIFVGAYMFGFTADAGRPESSARRTDLPPLVLFTHPTLALAGLAAQIAFLVSGLAALAWTAFAFLVLTVLLGDVLLVRTLRAPREQTAAATLSRDPADRRRAEDRIPHSAMLVHGVLAVALVGAVLTEAVRASF